MKIFSDSYTGWMFVKGILLGVWMVLKILWPWLLAVCAIACLFERLKRKIRK